MNAMLGDNLRSLRKARGLTLEALAEQVGCSVGWLSQVERGKSQPSETTVEALGAALGANVSLLFGAEPGPEVERGFVVRAGARRTVKAQDGLTEELLSPDLTDAFEVVRSEFAPGARLGRSTTRATQEVGYLVSGRLTLTVAGRRFELEPGDSFRIRGDAFEWENPHDAPAVAIWVIAPPIY